MSGVSRERKTDKEHSNNRKRETEAETERERFAESVIYHMSVRRAMSREDTIQGTQQQ